MRIMTTLATLSIVSVSAAQYGLSDYYFVDPDRPWHVEGQYRAVGKSKFETKENGHLDYSDADAGIYYTQFLNEENSLTYELGYDFLRLDWSDNPRFKQPNFNYLIGSLGYVSTTVEKWRWIANAGFSVDANYFDFAKSAVGHGMLWGRYQFADNFGVHVGIMGWYGVLNGEARPIFGFDWRFNDQWKATTIFPLDFSLAYAFADNWALEAAYSAFGGPYRYPRRAHEGRNGYHDSIFMLYSNGADLSLKYKFEHLLHVSLGIGWDFGGWIFIKNHENRHGKYFHFNSAPYAQGSVALTF